MKKTIALLLCVLMALAAFTACAPPAQPGDTVPEATQQPAATEAPDTGADEPDEPAAPDPISLRYWAYSRWQGVTGVEPDGEFGDWQRLQAENFMGIYPHITIEFEHLPWDSGPERVSVSLAAGTQPDVLEDGMLRGFGYANMGALLTFDDALTAEERGDIIDEAWDLVKWTDGLHYGMPWGNMSIFALINKTMFEEAGAADLLPGNPDRTWTFEEFETALAAVSRPSEGVYGGMLFAGNEQGDNANISMMRGFGAYMLTPDLTTARLNSPEAVAFAEAALSLIDKKCVMPGAESLLATEMTDFFAQQRVAVILAQSTGNIATVKAMMERGEIDEFEISWAMMPSQAGIDPSFNANIVTVLAFQSGDPARERAAQDLAIFVTSGENAKAVQIINLISTRHSTGNLYEGNELMMWSDSVSRFAVDPGIASPVWAQLRATLFPALQAIFSKSMSPEDAFAQFDAQAQVLLDEAN